MDEPPPDDPGFAPPPGFVRSGRRGPFTEHNGPVYHHNDPEPGAVIHGFHALHRHCNGFGIVHGGMLASFLDGLLGHAVGGAAHKPGVTIHLSIDYLSMARAGDWIEGEARLSRLAGDVAFAEAHARVKARQIVRATAIFKLMERPGR
jgi:acyl-coenzyme A thioesterase PaaI-like protein